MMSYTYGKLSCSEWVTHWIAPLFENHPSQDIESNWPHKKKILTKSLGTHAIEIQKLILTTVVGVLQDDEKVLSLLPKEIKLAPESYLLVVEACKIGAELEITVPDVVVDAKSDGLQGNYCESQLKLNLLAAAKLLFLNDNVLEQYVNVASCH